MYHQKDESPDVQSLVDDSGEAPSSLGVVVVEVSRKRLCHHFNALNYEDDYYNERVNNYRDYENYENDEKL